MARAAYLVTGALIAFGTAALPLSGQQPGANPDVLQALLTEVRGLRLAMEQMGTAGPRVQLAMGRLQLQEQRVNTLLRRLDTLREQRSGIERELASTREEITRLEEIAESQTADPAERKMMQAQARALKSTIEQRSTELQRLISEEAEVGSGLSGEQSRWTDINKALEDLERTLTSRR